MTPERWRRITQVFHLARGHDRPARAALLDDACAGDPALRFDVEQMLAADTDATGFGDTPVFGIAMAAPRLKTGARVGAYEVVAFLAAGGMGEVYRARDMWLGRDVALKILPDQFAHDNEWLARFKREAQVLAALNHPHIATLYGVEETGGVRALVLELIEGPTLSQRLATGTLPLADTLTLAHQVADALAAAHERGVIHCDLTPANILLTSAGDAKVLDFGVARRFVRDDLPSTEMADLLKDERAVRGTAAYMSPEQARGAAVDKRTDIWAFGCVLYEMLAGRTAFGGETASGTIAAILHDEPDWSALPSDTPATLRRLLASCLEKNVKLRRRDAADLGLEIDAILHEGRGAGAMRSDGGRRRRRALTLAVGAFAAAAVLTAARWPQGHDGADTARVVHTTIELPADAALALGIDIPANGFDRPSIALSPDGRLLAYIGQSSAGPRLYLRDLASQDVTPISGSEGAFFPFFSPDSRWLGFLTDDKVKKVAVTGGSPVTLCNTYVPGVASWLADGTIYFSEAQDKRISRVSAAGGPPTIVSAAAGFSSMLPDGKRALINPRANGISHDYTDVRLLSLETGESKVVIRSGYDARYVEPGYIVFARGGNLLAVPFDVVAGTVTGEPTLIASGATMESVWGQAQVTMSNTGVMAYVPGGDRSVGRLAWVDREGRTEFLPTPARVYGVVRLSANGRRLAAHVADVSDYVWIYDLARAESRRLTAGEHSGFPNWGRDNLTIAFAAWQSFGRYRLVIGGANGGAVHEVLPRSDETGYPTSLAADNRTVTLNTNRSWISITTPEGSVERFDMGSLMSTLPDLSPDGRFVAYAWHQQSGQGEVFVRSYADRRMIQQISADGGLEPHWCRCGELFYRNADRWMSAKIRTTPELQWDPAQPAFHTDFVDTPGRSYDVSPDGKRLLVVKRAQPDTRNRISLIVNWPARTTR